MDTRRAWDREAALDALGGFDYCKRGAKPTPNSLSQYHVFLASPGDVAAERQYVRKFFDDYNRSTAHIWRARFEVVNWENYATIGVGRPQELITRQTLEKYRESLVLVIGIMAQRFGSPSGKAESGTEEEFNWAMESHHASGFPEIKWFFRKVEKRRFRPIPARRRPRSTDHNPAKAASASRSDEYQWSSPDDPPRAIHRHRFQFLGTSAMPVTN